MKKLYATDKTNNQEIVLKQGTQKEMDVFKKQSESIPAPLNRYKNFRIDN
jgi:hypothetical protein